MDLDNVNLLNNVTNLELSKFIEEIGMGKYAIKEDCIKRFGKNVVKEPEEPKRGYYYWHCPNCGKAIDPGEKICFCGQRIRWSYPLPEEERMGFEVGDTVFSNLYKEYGVIQCFSKDLSLRNFVKVKLPNGFMRSFLIDDIKKVDIIDK